MQSRPTAEANTISVKSYSFYLNYMGDVCVCVCVFTIVYVLGAAPMGPNHVHLQNQLKNVQWALDQWVSACYIRTCKLD